MQFYHSKYYQAIISVKLISNSIKFYQIQHKKLYIYIIVILLQIYYNTKAYYKSIILGKKVLFGFSNRLISKF